MNRLLQLMALAGSLILAAPGYAGEYVDMFKRVCVNDVPGFNNARELAKAEAVNPEPEFFDSHETYYSEDGKFKIKFRFLPRSVQCDIITKEVAGGEELADFVDMINEFAAQNGIDDVFSRAGFYNVVIDDTAHLFSYTRVRGALTIVVNFPKPKS